MLLRCLCVLGGAYALGFSRSLPADDLFLTLVILAGLSFRLSDGVRFRFLHPAPDAAWEGNNASCVLEVATGNHRILLTGDIEAPVEATLLGNALLGPVDTVIVPHHGSRTSSTPDFVNTLRPALAIVSAGFDNRWGFPKTDVVRRWEFGGARLLETATSGAIGRRICIDSGVERLRRERPDSRKYWH